ncbi:MULTISPECIES: AlpA family transcriptional regulator [unclassified Saccharibacter]|uniref:helix-turn-helix transcriptional regulator n=1 Tax=unclassified Saccharibacter TaxID=2648722 RepID=UPI00132A03DE|nr:MULTISPECIES: AlpA family phage regulatory protein [unclassified Saccharibacter]MXV35931.1 AlpA family phage regulatory protein [Saccharibacter sp. EH611]MXV58051.1 AlpA family phage regulatory protein [Saccharibacter sp. EH70]MXV66289.1 AlpA family phage regulatory protein [Saccharibacter sp. EH60]
MTQVEGTPKTLFDSGELLTLEEILNKTKFSKTYLYKLMKEGGFPRSIKFSVQTVRWPSDEVNSWFENFSNDGEPEE